MSKAKNAVGNRSPKSVHIASHTIAKTGLGVAMLASPSGRTRIRICMAMDGSADVQIDRDGIVLHKLPVVVREPAATGTLADGKAER